MGGKMLQYPQFLPDCSNCSRRACDRISEFCHLHYDFSARFQVELGEGQESASQEEISSGFSSGSSDEIEEEPDMKNSSNSFTFMKKFAKRRQSTPSRLA